MAAMIKPDVLVLHDFRGEERSILGRVASLAGAARNELVIGRFDRLGIILPSVQEFEIGLARTHDLSRDFHFVQSRQNASA